MSQKSNNPPSELPKINERQALFVLEYIKCLNAAKAAIFAGYGKSGARQQGHRLLQDVDICLHIEQALEDRKNNLKIEADVVLSELFNIGMAKVSDFVENASEEDIEALDPEDFDDHKEYRKELRKLRRNIRVKPIDEMGSAIAGLNEIGVGSHGVAYVKIKDKVKSLELVGKHIGMFNYEPEKKARDRSAHYDRISESLQRLAGAQESRDGSEGEGEV